MKETEGCLGCGGAAQYFFEKVYNSNRELMMKELLLCEECRGKLTLGGVANV